MRRNVGTEKDTAYGGARRPRGDLSAILPPRDVQPGRRLGPEEIPGERHPERQDSVPGVEPKAGERAADDQGLLKATIDGVEVRVPKGTTIFQAAEKAGYTPPHFCYHRDLSIPANCRMCLCEIEGQGKPQTSCSVAVADGMVVRFDSPLVKEAVQGVLEFEFKNHPLDCPVCDQVGECYLQRYYLEVGKYRPHPVGKVHKDKVKDLGPITLDAERCVLCSRCVRFGEEIAGTADFVIANRSDHAEIQTFADRPIDTDYALNYTDICPVGALTSNDFRFRKRVYWLHSTKSVCPECSTGCNAYVDTAEDVVYRYRPRHNDLVNDSWMCDPGRLSYARVADTSHRLIEPQVREEGELRPVDWEAATDRAAAILADAGGRIAAIAHPRMSNEDLDQLRGLVEAAGGGPVDFRVGDDWRRVDELTDGILIRADPHPNTRGALTVLGLDAEGESMVGAILADVASGATRALIVAGWSPEELGGAEALEGAGSLVFLGPWPNGTAERADVVLPVTVHVERDGTFTNHAGRVQRIRPAVSPHEESRPGWRALADVRHALDGARPPADAAAAFALLAGRVAAFAGLSYEKIGDLGAWLKGWEKDSVPPVGARPRPGVRAPNIT